MAKTTDPLDATLRQAADYFGCDRDWLGAQVSEAGLRPVRATRYDMKALCRLLMDDDPRNLTVSGRAQLARTQMLERKDAEQRRDLIPFEEVERIVGRTVAVARQALVTTPAALEALGISPHKCNRADRMCADAIREIERAAQAFDGRLAIHSDGVVKYAKRLEADNARFLERLAPKAGS